jgi:CHAT domain-containing protein/Tfp pilus assembly protein PilF
MDFDSAYALASNLLERAEMEFGSSDTLVARVLDVLAKCCEERAEYVKAESFRRRALSIRTDRLSTDHDDISGTLNSLAVTLLKQGKFAEGDSLLKRALEIRQNMLGPDHPDVAMILTNRAGLCYYLGDYREAEDLYKRSLTINEKAFGTDHIGVARLLNNLATVIKNRGRYFEAEDLYIRSLAIKEKLLGADNPETAKNASNLANVYVFLGMYSKAEPLYKRALSVIERVYGSEHPSSATIRLNLMNLYLKLDKLDEAEPLGRQALRHMENRFGREHPSVGTAVHNLAIVCMRVGRRSEADSLFRRALAIRKEALGEIHPDVARTLFSLASLLSKESRLDEADSLYNQVLKIWQEILGPEHPAPASCLHNLARLKIRQGRYDEADSLLNLAQRIWEAMYGSDHHLVAKALETKSTLLRLEDRYADALDAAMRACTIRRDNFIENSITLSERDALTYAGYLRNSVDNYLSCLMDAGLDDPNSAKSAADIVLACKGQVFDGMFEARKIAALTTDSTSRALTQQIRYVKADVSELYVQAASYESEALRLKMDSLNRIADDLEAQLLTRSAAFRERQQTEIGVDRIGSLLPDRSALIEYVKYNYRLPESDTSVAHYMAIVVDTDMNPVALNLGRASSIDTLISEYRQHMLRLSKLRHMPLQRDKESYATIARELYRHLVHPVEDYTTDKRMVFISPDGGLNLISFSGLIHDNGDYLIERFSIHYLATGRELIRLKDNAIEGSGLLAIGDPDYDADVFARQHLLNSPAYVSTEGKAYASRNLRSGCGYFSDNKLARLPGTRREVEQIAVNWQANSTEPFAVYLGAEASEDVLKTHASGKRCIHLATHGYYVTGQCESGSDADANEGSEPYAGENPLLQSGLFFAGANHYGNGADGAGIDDGVLTAYEVSEMNLHGADMVVLSACESGLGRVQEGEGVYGLRRAFQMAGARTVVSALWPVPDQSAAAIMAELYSSTTETVVEKIRRTELDRIADLRKNGLADHPYSWAAFIALGDWR